MIKQLLDVDKIASGNLELTISGTTTKAIVEQSVNSIATMSKRKKMEVVTPAASINLKADEERLVQLLINLVSNALKFRSPAQKSRSKPSSPVASWNLEW